MDSTFIYPVTIHRGAALGSTSAAWISELPMIVGNSDEKVAVLYASDGFYPQGLYLTDTASRAWRFIMPYSAICTGILDGSSIDVYYAVEDPDSGLTDTSRIWRNGIETDDATFSVNDGAVFGALTTTRGTVVSINNILPDENGNVTLGIAQIPGLTAELALCVKSVNSALPDANGNVIVPIATTTIAGTVKGGGDITIASDGTLNAPVSSVSGQVGAVVIEATDNNDATGISIISDSGATTGDIKLKTIVSGTDIAVVPDPNGNLQINSTYALPAASISVLGGVKQGANVTIAADGTISVAAPFILTPATTTTLGGVIVGSGLTVDVTGNLSADVTSVNGHRGAVVLSANDITTGTFIASVLGATPGSNEILVTDAEGNPTWTTIIPSANLPGSLLGAVDYVGTFIPGTTVLPPAQADNKGWYFVATAAGTYTPPPDGPPLTFSAGSWIISNGTEWDVINVQGSVTSDNGQVGAAVIQVVNNDNATGTSLIVDGGATTGTAKLKTIVAGSNISVTADPNGNIEISGSAGGVTQIASIGTGNSLVDDNGTSDGIALIRSLAAGQNITIEPDAQNQTLTITANQVINPATTGSLGGIIVGAGLSVTSSGLLSVTAVGGVTSVNGQTGVVTVSATDTSTLSGISLITDSGATTSDVKIRRLVAGPGISLITDVNNNLQITNTADSGGYARYDYDATANQASFPVTFLESEAVEVFRNGGILLETDYSTGLTGPVVLNTPCNAGDDVVIIVQGAGGGGGGSGGNGLTSIISDATTGSVSILEANPPANSAITKSLIAGNNVTITDSGSTLTIAAALPPSTVASINNIGPNISGNVVLTAANVNALPLSGGTMSGEINMASNVLTGIPTPANPSDAVPLSFLTNFSIDNGTF